MNTANANTPSPAAGGVPQTRRTSNPFESRPVKLAQVERDIPAVDTAATIARTHLRHRRRNA